MHVVFKIFICRALTAVYVGYTVQIKIEGIAQLESGLELAEGDN